MYIHFKKYNFDLIIIIVQVSRFLKKQADNPDVPSPPVSDEQHKTIITQIFDHEDKNKDGFISHDEFSGPKHDEF